MAFAVGPFAVRWYGLAYLAGFVGAAAIAYYFARRWDLGLDFDDLTTIVLCIVLGLFVGARLGYCLFYEPAYYLSNPLRIIAFWNGGIAGMSFHGGLIGAVVGGLVTVRFVKVSLLRLGDLAVIGAPVGLALGRMANFINGELWGKVTTMPWGVVFPGAGPLPRHPSQVYEALLEGVLMLIMLLLLALRRPPLKPGAYLGIFLMLYGVFRIVVEFFRVPDMQLGYLLGGDWLTMGMVLSLPMLAVGAFLLYRVYSS